MNDTETLEPKIIERGTNPVKARINFQRKIWYIWISFNVEK